MRYSRVSKVGVVDWLIADTKLRGVHAPRRVGHDGTYQKTWAQLEQLGEIVEDLKM